LTHPARTASLFAKRRRPRGVLRRCIETKVRPLEPLDAASPREFPGLEAFFAEHGAPLGRFEGHRRFLTAGRACGDGFDPLAGHPRTRGPRGPLSFTSLAPLWLVFEVLVGEELLLSRRPDELRATI